MKVWMCFLTCLFSLSLGAEDAPSQFEKMTGLKGSYNETEKVFKASFPRTDIKVSVDKIILDPFMGLPSCTDSVAFSCVFSAAGTFFS